MSIHVFRIAGLAFPNFPMKKEAIKRKGKIFAVTSPGENQQVLTQVIGNHLVKMFVDGASLFDYMVDQQEPDLILLVHQPSRLDAISIVETLKTQPGLKTIPVIVLGHSASRDDIQAIYLAGANCFVEIANDWNKLASQIELIYDYWFETVLLPKRNVFDFH